MGLPLYSATTVDVTPAAGLPMAGYVARGTQPAVGVHDRLTASLLWLSAGAGHAVCWVAVDALSLDTATATAVRAAVADRLSLPVDAVLLCCSHTHSGPAVWSTPNPPFPSQAEQHAIDRLVRDIARGAARLPATAAPVTVEWSVVPDAGVGGNRYDPAGPHDASAGVLSLRDSDGAVVAILADYACHPTVLGPANLAYSADYPAAARRVLTAGLAATEDVETPPVVLFLQGAAGDVSTRFTRRSQTFAEADRQGGILAGALLRGVLAGEPLDTVTPVVVRGKCVLPTRDLPTPEQARATLADAERARTGSRVTQTRYEGATILAALAEAGLPDSITLPMSVVSLGDVAWVHLPVEPFTVFGERIRAASPFPVTRIIGYTDGYLGYLADEQAHREGRYEALASLVDAAAGDVVVDRAVALLAAART